LKRKFVLSVFIIAFFLILGFCVVTFASQVETSNVSPMSETTLTFNLQGGQTFSGSLSITGGSSNDINFHVTNPQGATIVNSGRVSGGTSFSFTAESAGAYTLHFDNSFSLFSSKIVVTTYDVSLSKVGGVDLTLILVLVGVVIIALIAIFSLVAISNRKKNFSPSHPISQPHVQMQASSHQKYCTQCGAANDSSALFCEKCGNKF
jgi:ribosomal protein L40E